jgi:hypothetical protein
MQWQTIADAKADRDGPTPGLASAVISPGTGQVQGTADHVGALQAATQQAAECFANRAVYGVVTQPAQIYTDTDGGS